MLYNSCWVGVEEDVTAWVKEGVTACCVHLLLQEPSLVIKKETAKNIWTYYQILIAYKGNCNLSELF
jgi:hypothetical protein